MNQPNQVVVVQQDSNGLGLAGLIFSILGWLTCGAACIVGVFLSCLGLLSKGPKATAIAGLIVGLPGVLFFLFVGIGLIAGIIGMEAAINEAERYNREQAEQQQVETVEAQP